MAAFAVTLTSQATAERSECRVIRLGRETIWVVEKLFAGLEEAPVLLKDSVQRIISPPSPGEKLPGKVHYLPK